MSTSTISLVTGGNRGLGLEACRQLARRGDRVILAARAAATAGAAAAALRGDGLEVEAVELDVTLPSSIASLAARLAADDTRVDVLVNNAGVSLDGFDASVARRTIDVNFYGPLRVTDALLPRMGSGGVVVMVSSGMGELAALAPHLREALLDEGLTRERLIELMESFVQSVTAGRHGAEGWPSSAYRVSKAGLNALVRVLAPQLEVRGVRVNAVCPGWVRTDMGGDHAPRGVEEGAASIVWAARHGEGPTGGFFRDGRPIGW